MIDPAEVLREHVEVTLRWTADTFCDCCHMIWPCEPAQLAKVLQASNDWNLTLFRRCESAQAAGVMAFEAGVKLAGWRDHWRDCWRETNDARGRWGKRAEAAEKRVTELEALCRDSVIVPTDNTWPRWVLACGCEAMVEHCEQCDARRKLRAALAGQEKTE